MIIINTRDGIVFMRLIGTFKDIKPVAVLQKVFEDEWQKMILYDTPGGDEEAPATISAYYRISGVIKRRFISIDEEVTFYYHDDYIRGWVPVASIPVGDAVVLSRVDPVSEDWREKIGKIEEELNKESLESNFKASELLLDIVKELKLKATVLLLKREGEGIEPIDGLFFMYGGESKGLITDVMRSYIIFKRKAYPIPLKGIGDWLSEREEERRRIVREIRQTLLERVYTAGLGGMEHEDRNRAQGL